MEERFGIVTHMLTHAADIAVESWMIDYLFYCRLLDRLIYLPKRKSLGSLREEGSFYVFQHVLQLDNQKEDILKYSNVGNGLAAAADVETLFYINFRKYLLKVWWTQTHFEQYLRRFSFLSMELRIVFSIQRSACLTAKHWIK